MHQCSLPRKDGSHPRPLERNAVVMPRSLPIFLIAPCSAQVEDSRQERAKDADPGKGEPVNRLGVYARSRVTEQFINYVVSYSASNTLPFVVNSKYEIRAII